MKTLQSIDRAMMIVNAIAKANGEKNLSDLSRDLGMVITTLHGFIKSLEKWDLIQKDEETNRFYLGAKHLQLASCCDREHLIKRAAHPYLEELSKKYDETIYLAIPYEDQILYIDKVESTYPFRITWMVGHQEDYRKTAMGLLIGSHLSRFEPDPEEKKLIARHCRGNKAQRFDEDLQIYCIAVAFFNARHEILGALGFMVPPKRVNAQRKTEMFAGLNQVVQKLEQDLAWIL